MTETVWGRETGNAANEYGGQASVRVSRAWGGCSLQGNLRRLGQRSHPCGSRGQG